METHRTCGGLVSGYTLPQGYDDEGPLADWRVYICHRCGDWVSPEGIDDPEDVIDVEPGGGEA